MEENNLRTDYKLYLTVSLLSKPFSVIYDFGTEVQEPLDLFVYLIDLSYCTDSSRIIQINFTSDKTITEIGRQINKNFGKQILSYRIHEKFNYK